MDSGFTTRWSKRELNLMLIIRKRLTMIERRQNIMVHWELRQHQEHHHGMILLFHHQLQTELEHSNTQSTHLCHIFLLFIREPNSKITNHFRAMDNLLSMIIQLFQVIVLYSTFKDIVLELQDIVPKKNLTLNGTILNVLTNIIPLLLTLNIQEPIWLIIWTNNSHSMLVLKILPRTMTCLH